MKILFLLLLISSFDLIQCKHWVFLVAGARGYDNYRHQANVCHAYQLMLKNGVPKENIVTMMVDDIAYNSRNPFKGNIINELNGPNVYKGVNIDYKGDDVTSANFLKILQGQATNAGTGRVIESKPDDHIFVYYSDHGGKKFLFFPDDNVLYASKLNEVLLAMSKANRFAKMTIYVEACHSGSIFYKRLPDNINVYAVTAADPWESSYSCCYDNKRHAYLGDQFSGNWMHDTETHNIGYESLGQQYLTVQQKVYLSHISAYGDANHFWKMKVGEFQGNKGKSNLMKLLRKPSSCADVVSSWDVRLNVLQRQLSAANGTQEVKQILHEINEEKQSRDAIRQNLEDIVSQLSHRPLLMMFGMKVTEVNEEEDKCYEESVNYYIKKCKLYRKSNYFFKDVHVFENLCHEGIKSESIKRAIKNVC